MGLFACGERATAAGDGSGDVAWRIAMDGIEAACGDCAVVRAGLGDAGFGTVARLGVIRPFPE
jgi:hypothetical protein